MRYGYNVALFGIGVLSFLNSCMRSYETPASNEPVPKFPCEGKDTIFESYVSGPYMIPCKDAVILFREQSGVCRVDGNVVRYHTSPKFSEKPGQDIDPGITLSECDDNGENCFGITDEATREMYIDKIDSMLTGKGRQ